MRRLLTVVLVLLVIPAAIFLYTRATRSAPYLKYGLFDTGPLSRPTDSEPGNPNDLPLGFRWECSDGGDFRSVNDIEKPRYRKGRFWAEAVGPEPTLVSLPGFLVDSDLYGILQIRYRASAGKVLKVQWRARGQKEFSGWRRMIAPIKSDDKFHTVSLNLYEKPHWKGLINAIRIIPSNKPCSFAIDYVRLLPSMTAKDYFPGLAEIPIDGLYKRGRYEVFPCRFTHRIWLPSNANIELGFGASSQTPFEAVVTVKDDNGMRIALARTEVTTEDGWKPLRLTLQNDREREVELSISMEGDPGIAAVAEPVVTGGDRSTRGPNVVMIVVDTLRADRLSPYGNNVPNSPAFSKLARRGTLFRYAKAQSTWTHPSVASILTSAYPSQIPVGWGMGNGLENYEPVLPEVLRKEQFRTAAFIGNRSMLGESGFVRGFEHYFIIPGKMRDQDLTPKATQWLEEHKNERFFLYVQYMDPHTVFEPPDELRKRFAPEVSKDHGLDMTEMANGEPFDGSLEDAAATLRGLYDGEVASVDREIEELCRWIYDANLQNETIVVLTSDHGEEIGDHGGWKHGYTVYEELARIPLVFFAPGRVASSRRLTEPSELIDLVPTLLHLAGVESDPRWHGRNLASLLDPDRSPVESSPHGRGEIVISESRANAPWRISVQDQRFKFIFFDRDQRFDKRELEGLYRGSPGVTREIYGRLSEVEFYDLWADPGETNNLMLVSERPPEEVRDRAEKLQSEMAEFRLKHGDVSAEAAEEEPSGELQERLRALGYIQ